MKSTRNPTREQTLYNEFARYYDIAYAWKDYTKDAGQIKGRIKGLKRSDGNKLLEVACGTGNFLKNLNDSFSCTGLDISKDMLALARGKKIPEVKFKRSDMVNMSLGEKFDVVLCLFGSIAYVKTYKNLKKTLTGFSNHLNPGGVVIVEPWFVYPSYEMLMGGPQIKTEHLYKPGLPYVRSQDTEELKIVRIRNSKLDGHIQTLYIHSVIAEKDKPVVYFFDKQQVGLFDIRKTIEIMEKAGLETSFDDKLLSGTFIGIKRR